jgi:hypothetical protein
MNTTDAESEPDIRVLFEGYLSGKENDTHRYESFDLCYHHFRAQFRDSDKKIIDPEKSCAILSAYLASWGMMRGSSFLLDHNYKKLLPVIEYFAKLDEEHWEIDVESYPQNYDRILGIYDEIKGRLISEGSRDLTLVTKIMLGVLGIVPAFDGNFTTFMREQHLGNCKFRRFNRESLEAIHQFYMKNKALIDSFADDNRVRVVDFDGNQTELKYSTAKVIDMIGFIGGGEILEKRKKEKQAEKEAAESLGRVAR